MKGKQIFGLNVRVVKSHSKRLLLYNTVPRYIIIVKGSTKKSLVFKRTFTLFYLIFYSNFCIFCVNIYNCWKWTGNIQLQDNQRLYIWERLFYHTYGDAMSGNYVWLLISNHPQISATRLEVIFVRWQVKVHNTQSSRKTIWEHIN